MRIFSALVGLVLVVAGVWQAWEYGYVGSNPRAPTVENFKLALDRYLILQGEPSRLVCLTLPLMGEAPNDLFTGLKPEPVPGIYRVQYPVGVEKDAKRRSELALLEALSHHGIATRRNLADGGRQFQLEWSTNVQVPANSCIYVAERGTLSIERIEKQGGGLVPRRYRLNYTVSIRKWLSAFEASDLQDAVRSYWVMRDRLKDEHLSDVVERTASGWRVVSSKIAGYLGEASSWAKLDLNKANDVFRDSLSRGDLSRLPPRPCLPLPKFQYTGLDPDNALSRSAKHTYSAMKLFDGYPSIGVPTNPGPSRLASALAQHSILTAEPFVGTPPELAASSGHKLLGGARLRVASSLVPTVTLVNQDGANEHTHCIGFGDGVSEVTALRESPLIERPASEDRFNIAASYAFIGRIRVVKLDEWMQQFLASGGAPEADVISAGLPFAGRFTLRNDKWIASIERIYLPVSVAPFDRNFDQEAISDLLMKLHSMNQEAIGLRNAFGVSDRILDGRGLEMLPKDLFGYVLRTFRQWRTNPEARTTSERNCDEKESKVLEMARSADMMANDPIRASIGIRLKNEVGALSGVVRTQCQRTRALMAIVLKDPRFEPSRIESELHRAQAAYSSESGRPRIETDAKPPRPLSGRHYSIPPAPNAPGRSRVLN